MKAVAFLNVHKPPFTMQSSPSLHLAHSVTSQDTLYPANKYHSFYVDDNTYSVNITEDGVYMHLF